MTDFDKHRDRMVRSLEHGGKAPAGALPVTFVRHEKVKPGKLAAPPRISARSCG